MSKANAILSNNLLTDGILNLMTDANEAIMRVYEVQNNEVEIKNDNTPVTKADLAANRILTEGLKKIKAKGLNQGGGIAIKGTKFTGVK